MTPVFTLYQWNQARGLYEVSKDYAFVRDAEGLYTITSLHDDWAQYEEGNLYYEDTLCDVREDTKTAMASQPNIRNITPTTSRSISH